MPNSDPYDAGFKPVLRPAAIIVDPRKFLEYVLVPGGAGGKSEVFLGLLGFRPGNSEDALELVTIYAGQAADRVEVGDYALSLRDEHGQRITITIEVRGVPLRTGWMVEPEGALRLLTPFSGFAGRREIAK